MIDIVICLDRNFIMQAGVFITSLLNSNSPNEIHIHVVSNNLQDEDEKKLKNITEKYGAKISFYHFDIGLLKDFPVRKQDHISLATYYRIMLPKILPETLNKVLYLDCDMIVVDSLEDLYNEDLSNYSSACVADMFYDDKSITDRLGYNVNDHYFNAGMFLINLDFWRKNDIASKAMEFIANNPEKCIAHDQDALNAILHGTIKITSARYNIQLDFLKKDPSNMIINDKLVLEEALSSGRNPCIIHFTGPSKPWKKQGFNPFTPLWDFYQNMTDWKDLKKTNEFSGIKLFKWHCRRFLEFFKVLPPRTSEYINVNSTIDIIKARSKGKI